MAPQKQERGRNPGAFQNGANEVPVSSKVPNLGEGMTCKEPLLAKVHSMMQAASEFCLAQIWDVAVPTRHVAFMFALGVVVHDRDPDILTLNPKPYKP